MQRRDGVIGQRFEAIPLGHRRQRRSGVGRAARAAIVFGLIYVANPDERPGYEGRVAEMPR